MDGKKTIYGKLIEVQKKIGTLKKDGQNKQQGYSYFSDDQIAEIFQQNFNEVGILFVPSNKITSIREVSPTSKGTKQFVTDVEVSYKMIDIETGDFIEGVSSGSGCDTGDKGVYKAITGAVKYIFMKTFHIGTGSDPEKDEVKDWKSKETKAPIKQDNMNFGDENNDIPSFPEFKPKFDGGTFNAFKTAVEQRSFDISDPEGTVSKIKDKYDIDEKYILEIKGFIKSKK